ncbi:MAG: RICIN domain-containing protein [Muribaculaceae bacterium]|nr:RICIN domain-containing protein [Muribaculaceae bacterium]
MKLKKIRNIAALAVVMVASQMSSLEVYAEEIASAWGLYSMPQMCYYQVFFDPYGEGKKLPIRWGFDTAWNSSDNMKRGVRFATAATISCARVSFQPWAEITTKGVLPTSLQRNLNSRMNTVALIGKKVDIMLNLDGGDNTVTSVYGGYKYDNPDDKWNSPKTYIGDVVKQGPKWADLIDATAAAVQAKGYEVVTVAPLNEPDFELNGTPITLFYEIAKNLKDFTKYPRFKDIRISGGNTLNDDEALRWYEYNKEFLDEGNTHQLAGDFNHYADFFTKVREDGKHATADELHNVMEAMVGVEYGMQTGIWWGTAELARGEFMKASFGERLGYAENRTAWSAASVYRAPDGKIQGFLGCSERQARPSVFNFVSVNGDVFVDGHGPLREYTVSLPADPNGAYQTEYQRNAENVVAIEMGEDIRPLIDGDYILVNKNSKMALGGRNSSTSNQTRIQQQTYTGASHQKWTVKPVPNDVGGDFSYFWISNSQNGQRMDDLNYSLNAGQYMIFYAPGTGANQQWSLEYDGDGWFHIRNKHSALYLQCSGQSSANLTQQERADNASQMWRFVPVDAPLEFDAPDVPQGLKATSRSASVMLEWTPVADAGEISYMVLRAEGNSGKFNIIARGLKDVRFLDNTVSGGRYDYKIVAMDASGNRSGDSETAAASVAPNTGEIAYFPLMADLSDAGENNFSVWTSQTPSFGNEALTLNSGQFAQLPYTILDSDEFTVIMNATRSSKPLFSTGYGKENNLTLCLANSGVVTLTGVKDDKQDMIIGPEVDRDVMVSVAIVVSDGEASLYVNGELAGSGLIGLIPDHRTLTYIGRSHDMSLGTAVSVNKLRVFNRALEPQEIEEYVENGSSDVTALVGEDERVSTEYFTTQGLKIDEPVEKGITIVRKRLSDGTVTTNKIVR